MPWCDTTKNEFAEWEFITDLIVVCPECGKLLDHETLAPITKEENALLERTSK